MPSAREPPIDDEVFGRAPRQRLFRASRFFRISAQPSSSSSSLVEPTPRLGLFRALMVSFDPGSEALPCDWGRDPFFIADLEACTVAVESVDVRDCLLFKLELLLAGAVETGLYREG